MKSRRRRVSSQAIRAGCNMHTQPLTAGRRRIINQKWLLRPVRNSRRLAASWISVAASFQLPQREANSRDWVILAMLRCFFFFFCSVGLQDWHGLNPGGWHATTRRASAKLRPQGTKPGFLSELTGRLWWQPVSAVPLPSVERQSVSLVGIWCGCRFSLWIDRTGCILIQSSWKCRKSVRKTPRLPVRQFSKREGNG